MLSEHIAEIGKMMTQSSDVVTEAVGAWIGEVAIAETDSTNGPEFTRAAHLALVWAVDQLQNRPVQ